MSSGTSAESFDGALKVGRSTGVTLTGGGAEKDITRYEKDLTRYEKDLTRYIEFRYI